MPPESPVLVGLSGGADSVTLLHLLCRQREEHYFPLYAAHVNHGIRTDEYGNEADRDETFCIRLCERLKVKLFAFHANIPLSAKETKNSLETEARNLRYRFFSECMTEHGIKILATAHNSDDNLETQIFNLSRGCGIDGICGIKPFRIFDSHNELAVVRPILRGSKKEILRFCSENGLEFVTDSTNFENDCTRNCIRNIIVPELEKLFGSPQNSASRLSESLLEAVDFLDRNAQLFFDKYVSLSAQAVSVPTDHLITVDDVIKKRILSKLFSSLSETVPEKVHIDAMMNLLKSESPSAAVALPGGFQAFCNQGLFIICSNDEFGRQRKSSEENFGEVTLNFGWNKFGSGAFSIYIGNTPCDSCTGKRLYARAAIDRNTDIKSLTARQRKEGDLIESGGMHKRVKKLMCDKKIPISDRELLPLICKNHELIFVPGCAVSENIKATGAECIFVEIYKNNIF